MKRVPIKDATLSLCGWAYQLYVRLGCVYILLVLRTDATRTRNPGTWAQPQGRAKEQELWVNGEEKGKWMELKPCLIGEIMQLPGGGPGPDPTCHSGWRRHELESNYRIYIPRET